jgi:quercetin dioxygenase-like cupin family protein
MHSKPESAQGGISFDLGVVARELRGEEAYERSGHAARTLVREPDLRLVVIALKDGARISEHKAQGTTTVHALAGLLRLRLGERLVELSAGQMLVMDRGLPHDVEATGESALLLTLGWSQSR